jgi:hypothetical protein
MPEKMPERSKTFIEAECLKAAKRQLGCGDLQRVLIERIKPRGSGPNWQVLEFTPALPRIARDEAMTAIAPLRQKYALAPSLKK